MKTKKLGLGVYSLNNIPLRTRIYGFVIFAFIFLMFTAPNTSAGVLDMFGFATEDLYVNITQNIKQSNDLLKHAFEFAQTSPYDVVNILAGTAQGIILTNIRNAIISMSLVIATLLLMVEFFRKSINFEWSSKWENILIFLVKIIVIKQVVQNADVIVGYIYAGFQSINDIAIGGEPNFLPYGTTKIYSISKATWMDQIGNFFSSLFGQGANISETHYTYEISENAVKMFYPEAGFPPGTNLSIESNKFLDPTSGAAFNATLEMFLLQPYFLIMKAIAIVIFVICIGRVFELAVYTIFAPLPLATFASETTNDVGKSFIKNYIACVLQIAVIAVMFMVYVGVDNYFTAGGYGVTILIKLVSLISLGLGIIKSGSWARKVCGVG